MRPPREPARLRSKAARAPPRAGWAGVRSGETRLRVVTALVLMPLALALVWAGGWWTTGAAAVAAALMGFEWVRAAAPGRWARLALIYAAAFALSFHFAVLGDLRGAATCLLAGAATAGVWAFASGRTRHRLLAVLGVIYIGFPCLVFVSWQMNLGLGAGSLVWLLCSVWAADIGAYVIGSRFGRRLLWPAISPGKTWEGLAGGMAVCGIHGVIMGPLLTGLGPVAGLTLGVALGLLAEMGDMIESAAKRAFGLKDMSRLVPGHGGVLDRLDSLLFVVSVAGLGVLIWTA